VINEDWIAANGGFPDHPHRDMEIVTFIVEGELEHRDSMGNGSVIQAGDIQRMSAGSGIVHSEFNHSGRETVHLLQIWIETAQKGITPEYEQIRYLDFLETNVPLLIASGDGSENAVRINQDVDIYYCRLETQKFLDWKTRKKRYYWIQIIAGGLDIGQHKLNAGDGASVTGLPIIEIRADDDCEFLVFDLK
jgi:redox-sensitive bicupin YhaK (pirin superfamily)